MLCFHYSVFVGKWSRIHLFLICVRINSYALKRILFILKSTHLILTDSFDTNGSFDPKMYPFDTKTDSFDTKMDSFGTKIDSFGTNGFIWYQNGLFWKRAWKCVDLKTVTFNENTENGVIRKRYNSNNRLRANTKANFSVKTRNWKRLKTEYRNTSDFVPRFLGENRIMKFVQDHPKMEWSENRRHLKME